MTLGEILSLVEISEDLSKDQLDATVYHEGWHENMAIHVCSKCGHAEHIFGHGGGERMCKDFDVEFLGGLPLDITIREQADSGKSTVVADPDGKVASIYRDIARKVAARIARQAEDRTAIFPKIVVQNT